MFEFKNGPARVEKVKLNMVNFNNLNGTSRTVLNVGNFPYKTRDVTFENKLPILNTVKK